MAIHHPKANKLTKATSDPTRLPKPYYIWCGLCNQWLSNFYQHIKQ